jgi:hypothetical protein
MKKYGFVYIWYDKKRKMFYVGCHWGHVDDGYICSSNRMRDAYRRRPNDFKRRILEKYIDDKKTLLEYEYKWLSKIKKHELNEKYYNVYNHHFSHWMNGDEYSTQKHPMYGKKHTEETKKKISESGKGRTPWNKDKTGVYSEETLKKMGEKHLGNSYNTGKKHSEESKQKMSEAHLGVETWNKGKTGVYSEETLKKMSESSKGQNAWNKGKTCPQLAGNNNGAKKLKGKSWKIDKNTGKRVWIESED